LCRRGLKGQDFSIRRVASRFYSLTASVGCDLVLHRDLGISIRRTDATELPYGIVCCGIGSHRRKVAGQKRRRHPPPLPIAWTFPKMRWLRRRRKRDSRVRQNPAELTRKIYQLCGASSARSAELVSTRTSRICDFYDVMKMHGKTLQETSSQEVLEVSISYSNPGEGLAKSISVVGM